MDARKHSERQFHNQVFAQHTRAQVGRFYSVFRRPREVYETFLFAACAGKRVLEYGCGPGSASFALADRGATLVGIDISEVAITQAQQEASRRGLEATYQVMDAEALEFKDASFDLICGSGILHHLDLNRAFAELARTLKADGTAIFIEPLGHNPFINGYRRVTPKLRTQDEHPLLKPDFDLARRYFGAVRCQFFNLATLFAVPWYPRAGFDTLYRFLDRIDRQLFRLEFLRWNAWNVVLRLAEPHSEEFTGRAPGAIGVSEPGGRVPAS